MVRGSTFYLLCFSLILGSFTYSAILPQVADHLITSGMSLETAARAMSLLAAFGMAGKFSFGYLSELVTARRMMMVSLTGQAFFIVMMVLFPTPPIAWLAVPLFGLFMGSYGALINLVAQETFGLRNFGSIAGLMSLAMGVSGMLGPFLSGQSFDRLGSYGPGFISVAVMFVIGAISLTGVRRWTPEPIGRERMNLDEKTILKRLGAGESIDALCADAGMSRAKFDDWWQGQLGSRLPDMETTRTFDGQGPVEILRDETGTPHVYADDAGSTSSSATASRWGRTGCGSSTTCAARPSAASPRCWGRTAWRRTSSPGRSASTVSPPRRLTASPPRPGSCSGPSPTASTPPWRGAGRTCQSSSACSTTGRSPGRPSTP